MSHKSLDPRPSQGIKYTQMTIRTGSNDFVRVVGECDVEDGIFVPGEYVYIFAISSGFESELIE